MKMIKRNKSRLLPILIVSVLLIVIVPILLTTLTTKSSSSKVTTSGSYNAGYLAGSARLAEVQEDLDTALDAIDVLQEQLVEYSNEYSTAINQYASDQSRIQNLTSENETLTSQNQLLSAEVSNYYNYTYTVPITFYVDGVFYCEGKAREGGSLLVFPTEPTKEDYVFSYWSTTQPGALNPEIVYSNTTFSTAISLYANFTLESQVLPQVTGSFTLFDDEYTTYSFDDGMTWNEYLNSNYCTLSGLAFTTYNSSYVAIFDDDNMRYLVLVYGAQEVTINDYVVDGAEYSFHYYNA